MSGDREFQDGAFYWIRMIRSSGWTVGQYEDDRPIGPRWTLIGGSELYATEEFAEIGPMIEPPPAPANAA